jgi:hypothetical protein
VTLIHATPAAIPPVERALGAIPDVRTSNLLDEGLLSEVDRRGGVTPECVDRMRTLIGLALAGDSDGVLVTCNIYSSAVEQIATELTPFPLISVDAPMIREAVLRGPRIGLLATVASGLRQQSSQLLACADQVGVPLQLDSILLEDAFAALVAGDGRTHDELLMAGLRELRPRVDVVVLAQASMARLLDVLPGGGDIAPADVLSSPQLAAHELAALLPD